MKMGKNDPRSSMSKSVKGKLPVNVTGRNPIRSASPAETACVGEYCQSKEPSLKQALAKDPVSDAKRDRALED
ncbi:MAG TPA: hypothetical protein VHP13_03980 [Gammaproteobacteria bacterium]|jgi:hypothetical protein|nr:hypothetical protein [Gammaproteobacteria bacterium]